MPEALTEHSAEPKVQESPAVAQQQTPSTRQKVEQGGIYTLFRKAAASSGGLEPPPEQFSSIFSSSEYSHPINDAQKARVLLAMQKQYGNRYVQRVLAGSKPAQESSDAHTPAQRSNGLMIQRFPENGSSTSAPPTPSPETATTPATTGAQPATTPARGMIVEDSVTDLAPGQVRKSEFLSQLKDAVCRTAEDALSGTPWAAAGCPYIDYWFSYYRDKDAQHIENAVRRYAPETVNVASAGDYIPIIIARVRTAVNTWATTGEVTDVPEGIPTDLFGIAGAASSLVAGAGTLVSGIGSIFRKSRNGGPNETGDPSAIQAQLGAGHSLEGSTGSRMQSAFQQDFSHVRVHTDSKASELSTQLNARAFTVGQDVAFGAGEYQPGTLIGDALIAHELAHVVQQGGSSTTEAPLQKAEGDYNAFEEDADLAAIGAVVASRNGQKQGTAKIPGNVIPRLRSGLRLQRCGGPGEQEVIVQREEMLTKNITFGEDPFEIHVWAAHNLKFDIRSLHVDITYKGNQDADKDSVGWILQMPNKAPNPKIDMEKEDVKDAFTGEPRPTVKMIVDVFNDKTNRIEIGNWVVKDHILIPPIRHHSFYADEAGKKTFSVAAFREIKVRSPLAERKKKEGTAQVAGPARTLVGTVLSAEDERMSALRTSQLMEIALKRLAEIKPDAPVLEILEREVAKDLRSPAGEQEALLRKRVIRLNNTLVMTQPVFPSLTQLSKKENYLPAIADQIVDKAEFIKGQYATALMISYSDRDPNGEKLAAAEQAMLEFPAFIAKLYVGPEGFQKTIGEIPFLRDDINALRSQNGNGARRADFIVGLGRPAHIGPIEHDLYTALEKARKARFYLEPDALKRIRELTEDTQAILSIMTALALYEQFVYWEKLLDDSIVDWILDSKLKKARDYRIKFDNILKGMEKYGTAKTAEANRAFVTEGISQLSSLTSSTEFKEAVTAIQERLKTIATINVIGKIVLITAAAALTAGAAGVAVGGAMEGLAVSAGAVKAGVFAAEVLAFTITSRVGQEIAFGKAEGSFFADLAWNAVMFGVLKAATAGFTRAFKLVADPRAHRIAYGLGKAGTAVISLQAFAEAQHLIQKGRAMTGEERYRSALQNIILVVALEAGRFIAKPLEQRISAIINNKLKTLFTERYSALQSERLVLLEKVQKMERGEGTPEEIAETLKGIQELWAKEIKLLSDGAKRRAFSEADVESAMAGYKNQIALLELRLSQIGVEAPLGGEAPSFRPLGLGMVAYSPEARAVLESFYKDRGGTLKDSSIPNMLEGRLPSGELTFYVPEAFSGAFRLLPFDEVIKLNQHLQAGRITGDINEIITRIKGGGFDAQAAIGELRGLMRALERGYEKVEAITPPKGAGAPEGVKSPEAKIFKGGKEFRLEVKTATEPPRYDNWRSHFDKANQQIKFTKLQGEIYFDFTGVDVTKGENLTTQAEIERFVADKMRLDRGRNILYFEIKWRATDGTIKTTFRSRAADGTVSAVTTIP